MLQQYRQLAPTVRLSTRGGSGPPRRDETRRDETRRDETRRRAPRRDARDGVRGGRGRGGDDDIYDALIRELERVPDDVRDAVASFLQDLRRDGVDWHRIGDGGEFFDKESFFRTVHAGACVRAARIMGSGCLKFAHEHVAPWDEWTCAFAARMEIWSV